MVYFRKIEDASAVMDVLYAIVLGYKTPKEIGKRLGQGAYIRPKLQSLRENKIVVKEKWNYQPNWNVIYEKMLKALEEVLNYYESISQKHAKRVN